MEQWRMHENAQKYLDDMLDRAEFLLKLPATCSLDKIDTDRILRSAVERELMVLGEALYLLHQLLPELAERIDHWHEIVGMRHRLVHGYASVKSAVMIATIVNDLEPLVKQIREIKSELPE